MIAARARWAPPSAALVLALPERCLQVTPRRAAARSGSRVAVSALLAIAVFLLSERHARADEGLDIVFYQLIGGGAVIAASVPFLVADVVYTVEPQWLPPRWAITQIVLAGGVNAAVAISGMSLYSQKQCFEGYGCERYKILPVAIGATVLSVGFIAHGVASLVLYRPESPTTRASGIGRDANIAYLRWVPDVVVTRDGNAVVTFSGVF